MSDTKLDAVKENSELATASTAPAKETGGGKHSLMGIKLLAEVPSERLAKLEKKCSWVEYKPNDIIFELDDEGTEIYFIARGKLRIIIFGANGPEDDAPNEFGLPSGGGSVTLAEMVSGDSFGELSALDGRLRSARAMALDNCLLATLPRDEFNTLLQDCPKVAITLLGRLTGLIRSLNKRVHSLATLTPTQRIYMELVRLAEPNPQGDGSWIIHSLPPHGDIASWAGADRENVAQAIGVLARENIVERKHRSLIVKNHARLRMLAHL